MRSEHRQATGWFIVVSAPIWVFFSLLAISALSWHEPETMGLEGVTVAHLVLGSYALVTPVYLVVAIWLSVGLLMDLREHFDLIDFRRHLGRSASTWIRQVSRWAQLAIRPTTLCWFIIGALLGGTFGWLFWNCLVMIGYLKQMLAR